MNVDYTIDVEQELCKALGVDSFEDVKKVRAELALREVVDLESMPKLEISKTEWLYKALS